jgi:carboxypeptidase T
MKKILLLLTSVILGFSAFTQKYSKVKIYTDASGLQLLANNGLPVDHGVWKDNTFFISDFSEDEIERIQQLGFQTEVLIEDVVQYFVDANQNGYPVELRNATCAGGTSGSGSFEPMTPINFNLGTMGGYLKYNEMLAELDQMAALYPNLITVKSQISNFLTHENRPIYYVKISDNPNNDEINEPKVLYTAIHHAREPMSLMETIFYMWYLLENYETSEEIQYLVNNMQMYFVPCINPDGYIRNEVTNPNGGGMWRKNRRNNGGGVFGVDLNRNYSYGWGTTGTSTNPSNDTYCGPSAFSEPETQAMRWLVQNNNFISAFNAHTYAESILFPIGTTSAEFADHHDYFQDACDHMVELNGYSAIKSSGLYPASGDSDDYMYKVDIGVGQKDTIFVHTPEVGTAFWQPSVEIVPTCAEMVFPNLVLAHITKKYVVVRDTDPSSIPALNGVFNHSAFRLGLEDGPVTVSIEPLLNIQSVGAPIVYDLNLRQSTNGSISYSLDPGIQFGDEIIYVLRTEYGLWTKRDTIVKTFGVLTLQALENGATANWTGNWATTTSTFYSPSTSYTDSPTGNYANNANRTYRYVPIVDLTNATAAMVSFYAKWNIEADYDFVQFQVSIDGGTTWIGQCGNYTVPGTNANGSVQPNNQPVYEGVQNAWVYEEISLSDYLGQQIQLRFQLRSDGAVTADGFYFDDFKIMFNEAEPPTAPTASFTAGQNSICVGQSVAFTDFSTGSPTSWTWDFGDGSSSTLQSPTYVYAQAGTYTVSLTVSNNLGSNTLVETDLMVVNDLPIVSISSSDSDATICADGEENIVLTTVPSNAVVTGQYVTSGIFSTTVAGEYVVTATYTDENGCVGSSEIVLTAISCSTGNLLSNELMNVLIQPNPNEGVFFVMGGDVYAPIIIYDANGRKVYDALNLTEETKVDLGNVSSGLYYLQTTLGGNPIRVKISIL